MRGILFILLVFLIATPVAGAETRWYDVELIIFTPSGENFLNAEAWPKAPQLPEIEDAAWSPLPNGRQPAQAQAFKLLTPGEKKLGGAYRQLEASSQFEPLVHIGWRQPGLKENETVPVRITLDSNGRFLAPEEVQESTQTGSSFMQPDLPRLDGTVTVVLSRYLHLKTDLVYRIETDSVTHRRTRPDPAVIDLSTSVRSYDAQDRNEILFDQGPTVEEPRYLEFVVNDSRRMRSGELHYLDHPVLGVIAQITPSKGR